MVLTEEQLAKIEENRKRALALRQQKELEKLKMHQQQGGEQAPPPPSSSSSAALRELQHQAGFCEESNVARGDEGDHGVEEGGRGPRTSTTTCTKTMEGSTGIEGELVCSECGTGRADKAFYTTFGVLVCVYCKGENEDDYGLMSKADAVSEFLVQEGTMRVLPYLERSNPRHSSWTKMKLYLRKQVREKSYARWGGEEGLQAERDKRSAKKWETALKRTQNVFARGDKKKIKTTSTTTTTTRTG